MQTRPAAPMRGLDSTERGVIHNATAAGEFRASHNPGGLEVLWDDELRTERAPAKEPAKRWRNLYESAQPAPFYNFMVVCGPGQWFAPMPRTTWPSREIAEQKAIDFLARHREWADYYGVRHVRAEGQPNNT